ncbi:MAG: addiction module protein [Chloroflexi bacterium]|nr:addiction module protein [Chloroflexota bacterium]
MEAEHIAWQRTVPDYALPVRSGVLGTDPNAVRFSGLLCPFDRSLDHPGGHREARGSGVSVGLLDINVLSGKPKQSAWVRGKLNVTKKPEETVMAHAVEESRSLSAAEKVELLRSLIAELDAPADADIGGAWLEEAQRRHRDLVQGKVKGVPGERVFENLRSRLRR